jgi:TonB-linked SusC/RagA family outer membrane protein
MKLFHIGAWESYAQTKLLKVMKLTALLLTIFSLHVAAHSSAQITYQAKNEPMKKVLDVIRVQAGIHMAYNDQVIDLAKPVTVTLKNTSVKEALEEVFKDQPLTYSIVGKSVFVIKKNAAPIENSLSTAQPKLIDIRGKLLNSKNEPVIGASITIKGTTQSTVSNERGEFSLSEINEKSVLVITHVNYETIESTINGRSEISISLKDKISTLKGVEVVVNTGYQEVNKKYSPGSYATVDQELFNRKNSTDILSRIDGIVPGVLFDNRTILGRTPGETKIQIRGLYTLSETSGVNQPLIVLDNFPYEGNLLDINPNDVETITVLRDATATSIWGAKAGNGVIVITTKKGKYGNPLKVSFNSNLTYSPKPDLGNLPFISSADFIDIETELFKNGFYESDISNPQAPLTPVVEILLRRKNGEITADDSTQQLNALRGIDNRKDISKYYYRSKLNQQHSINVTGGSQTANYFFSVGYDKNLLSSSLDQYQRLSIRSASSFRPVKNLEVSVALAYTNAQTINNTTNWQQLSINGRKLPPYVSLGDYNGSPSTIDKYRPSFINTFSNANLLDWNYRPLQELDAANNENISTAFLASLGLKYKINEIISLEGSYQYQTTESQTSNIYGLETYYTRNLINLFTNPAATDITKKYPVPIGDIYDLSHVKEINQNFRGQLNISHRWKDHSFRIISGAEIREIINNGDQYRTYGYNERGNSALINYVDQFPILTGSSSPIPAGNSFFKYRNRFVSYYANGEFSLYNKYTIAISGRKDASNIFGVKTNEKGRPFWSAGAAWELSNESFYKSQLLPRLKIKASYGYSGNIDPSVSALTIVRYNPSSYNSAINTPFAGLISLPNPNLRWEKVRQANFGIEFESKDSRITGSIEYYNKKSKDVIYNQYIDPTTGSTGVKSNSAGMTGEGIDVGLNITPLQVGSFKYEIGLSFSYSTYKVNKLSIADESNYFVSNGTFIFPRTGYNPNVITTFKWAGLNPNTGNPIGMLNGKSTENYDSIVNNSLLSDIVIAGSSIPKYYGNILNKFSYKNISLSTNITYRLGYYFIKPTLSYSQLFNNYNVSSDYYERWKKPGDEQITNVPSWSYPINQNRDFFYQQSEVNVERGDHIRLQDVRADYRIGKKEFKKIPFNSIAVFVYVSNLNILLWKANDAGIDPDFPAAIKSPVSIAFGMKLDL